jgi:transcriptional antiterminator NusG
MADDRPEDEQESPATPDELETERPLEESLEEDPLEEDQGVPLDEIHPEASDGVHSEAAETAAEPGLPETDKHWYIIHAYSGFEQKVAESLRTRSQAFGFADRLGQILIPTEEVIELRNGKKVTSKRLLYPGYVLVEMEMDDELWHAVKSTPRVTGFVGGGTKPVPLTADEVNSVLYRQASSAERPRPKMTFEKSETVKIVDGPFTNFSGKVDEINSERNTLRVMVTIFGRSTPVELDFLQVEKI